MSMAADRQGRLEDRPGRLQKDLRPYRENLDMNTVLDELAATSPPFILRYEMGGVKYIQIVNFRKHQPIHWNETPSIIPPPPGWVDPPSPPRRKQSSDESSDEPEESSEDDPVPYAEIIADLNEVTEQHFRATTRPFRESIGARWKEGYTLDNFRHVHRVKFQDFLDGHFSPKEAPEKKVWLTPATLYRPGNFAKYVQQEINGDKRNPDVPV
jgi:uncharacterized phage protein (TIGR02220 family)